MSGDVFGNGMLLSEHIELVAAFDHRDIFIDPNPARRGPGRAPAPVRPAALELAGLRQDQDLQGRRRVLAHGQVDPAQRRDPAAAGGRRGKPHSHRADPCHPEVQDRPVVVRRHRHLPAGDRRERRRGRRPRQRCAARHRRGGARQGDRRGRQPRRHATRAHRVRRSRRPHRHRLHRQLGRRQHLRPGGQHQDRRGAGRAHGPAAAGGPQHAAGADDRGRRRGLAAQQLPAGLGPEPGRAPQRARARRLFPADAHAGGARPDRAPARGAAVRHRAAGARARGRAASRGRSWRCC